jgi:hypothetical protein
MHWRGVEAGVHHTEMFFSGSDVNIQCHFTTSDFLAIKGNENRFSEIPPIPAMTPVIVVPFVNVPGVNPSSLLYDNADTEPSPVYVPSAGWQAVNQNIPIRGYSDGRLQSSLKVPCPIQW